MWPPMWTRIAARGLWRSALRSKSSNDMQRSSRLQSTNSTLAPAPIAASGLAMKVLEGQSTVSPSTPANSSAARAPPAQLERPRLGSPFHCDQRSSKARSFAPSDHCSESRISVQSSNSRARSRWSNPIANLLASGSVFSAVPTVAPFGDEWLGYLPRRDATNATLETRRNLPAQPDQLPNLVVLNPRRVRIGSRLPPPVSRQEARSRQRRWR